MNENGSKISKYVRIIILLLLVVFAIIVIINLKQVQEILQIVLEWVNDLGFVGIIIFISIYIVATIALIPGSILTLGAGFLFGLAWGSIYTSIASTIGATLAFLFGRYLVRDWVEKKLCKYSSFASFDKSVGEEGRKIVLLTRLSPIFPFVLLNYAYGLTKVKLRDYFFFSWIGMIPGTIMYVYIGTLASNLANLGQGARTTGEWVLYGIGLAATIIVTLYIVWLARKALQKRMESEQITTCQDDTEEEIVETIG